MEKFMRHDFLISDIVLCAFVKHGTPIHRNRSSHGLVFYPDGGCTFRFIGGPSLKAEKNSVIYLPKGSDYNVITRGHNGCYAINFQTADDFGDAQFCVSAKNVSLYANAFEVADRAFTSAKNGYLMKCKSCLYDIISALQYEYSLGYISGDRKELVMRAADRIHETYAEKAPTVGELSELCGITPEYLRSLFKNTFGKSPVQYIRDLRLSRARELLASGMYSVADVAAMSGYSDPGYFSREFKRAFGVSPSEYGR